MTAKQTPLVKSSSTSLQIKISTLDSLVSMNQRFRNDWVTLKKKCCQVLKVHCIHLHSYELGIQVSWESPMAAQKSPECDYCVCGCGCGCDYGSLSHLAGSDDLGQTWLILVRLAHESKVNWWVSRAWLV